MNPLQKNKVDIKSLSPEEQRLFRLYGKLPSKSDHFAKHLKERKYFDSGDYALSKAGKANGVDTGSIGSQHPQPENIPHRESASAANGPNGQPLKHAGLNGVTPVAAASPAKEASFLNRETKPEEGDAEEAEKPTEATTEKPTELTTEKPAEASLPIRP